MSEEIVGSDVFSKHLAVGERLLWTGQPDPKRLFCFEDYEMIPFSIAWLAFSVYFTLGVLGLIPGKSSAGDATPFMFIVGVLANSIGIHFTIGRFLTRRRWKLATWYAVTDQRVLVLSEYPQEHMTAYPLKTLRAVNVTNDRANFGSVVFTPRLDDYWKVRDRSFSVAHLRNTAYWPAEGFFDIPNSPFVGQCISEQITGGSPVAKEPLAGPASTDQWLLPGEQVIWEDKPARYQRLSCLFFFRLLFLIAFGCASYGLRNLDIGTPKRHSAYDSYYLVTASILMMIVLLMSQQIKAEIRKRTKYYVTNLRVLMVIDGTRPWHASRFLAALPRVVPSSVKRERGSLIMAPLPTTETTGQRNIDIELSYCIRNSIVGLAGFMDIDDVKGVADMINGLRPGT